MHSPLNPPPNLHPDLAPHRHLHPQALRYPPAIALYLPPP